MKNGEVFVQKKRESVKVVASVEGRQFIFQACHSEATSGHEDLHCKKWCAEVAHLGVLYECLPKQHTFCCAISWCVIVTHVLCAKVAQLCVLYFHFQVPFHFQFHLENEIHNIEINET